MKAKTPTYLNKARMISRQYWQFDVHAASQTGSQVGRAAREIPQMVVVHELVARIGDTLLYLKHLNATGLVNHF